ncbi:MAG: nucleoside recognition protein [Rhizobiales bacterium]|nr:nucleoside recognition protein [Hyphomicrobiales bacterium]MBA69202.1 nucleoside recognition protein [Hyphomicrobiales bacterium]
MSQLIAILRRTPEVLPIYWMLFRITVPITILAELASRVGLIEWMAPAFAPVMNLVGLPPELGLAWLTAMIVGMWGAVPLLFSLVDISTLSIADVTIFSVLMLFAHGLPIEQKIIQEAGPGMTVTTILRIAGALAYGFILNQIFSATGWLSAPVDPVWIPLSGATTWPDFFWGLGEAMVWMFVILVALFWVLEILKLIGLMDLMMRALSPMLRLAGIKGEAGELTAIGLFLGISYGAGFLVKEARSGRVSPRQVFLSCAFMGFAHSVIEDTLLVLALGADIYSVLVGRVIFAVVATGILALLLRGVSETTFMATLYRQKA